MHQAQRDLDPISYALSKYSGYQPTACPAVAPLCASGVPFLASNYFPDSGFTKEGSFLIKSVISDDLAFCHKND